MARYVKTANLKEMRSGMRSHAVKADERGKDVLGTPYIPNMSRAAAHWHSVQTKDAGSV